MPSVFRYLAIVRLFNFLHSRLACNPRADAVGTEPTGIISTARKTVAIARDVKKPRMASMNGVDGKFRCI
jgi:hypothetical protein